MHSPDSITTKFFSVPCHVSYDSSVKAEIKAHFTPEIVQKLSGAIGGSAITVSMNDKGILMVATNSMLEGEMERQIVVSDEGPILLLNQSFMLKPIHQGQGIAVRSFAREVAAASSLGFAKIETEAAGSYSSKLFNGYYTWPRLGYDAQLTAHERVSLPPGLKHARSVLDLMSNRYGRAWWQINGSEKLMYFDLTLGSRSHKVLTSYMSEKGVRI